MDRDDGELPDEPRTGSRRLVLNPASGRADHAERVRRRAAEHGFPVAETERSGHAVELARSAAVDGVELLAVCGGDGTLHEVVQGIVEADALDAVTVCLVPAGTENIVASDVGVRTVADGFEVAERGETREVDLGMAGDEPFVMSAIAGLPADVSSSATHELKQRFGPLAFVVGAVQEGLAFDGIRVEVDAVTESGERAWTGEAIAVLVGNVRRFAVPGGQANAEDGLLEVTIVERTPSGEPVAEAIEQRLLDRDARHVRNLRTTRLDVVGLEERPITFSLDGEIREFSEVPIRVLPRALRLRVGTDYDPDPDD